MVPGPVVFGPTVLDRLVTLFSKLPGIGKKSASRIVYHILDNNKSYAYALAEELASLHNAIHRCGLCGGYTETDPCPICSDTSRDHSLICVVERAQDLRIIEETREFHGVFHVLGGLIAPLDGVGPEDLSIEKLLSRLGGRPGSTYPDAAHSLTQNIREIILALNPTIEGDTTALYLQKILKEYPVEVTRLASGLPVGGDLEYTDRLTLSRSFRGRIKV
jgi:recombination protein RecR